MENTLQTTEFVCSTFRFSPLQPIHWFKLAEDDARSPTSMVEPPFLRKIENSRDQCWGLHVYNLPNLFGFLKWEWERESWVPGSHRPGAAWRHALHLFTALAERSASSASSACRADASTYTAAMTVGNTGGTSRKWDDWWEFSQWGYFFGYSPKMYGLFMGLCDPKNWETSNFPW